MLTFRFVQRVNERARRWVSVLVVAASSAACGSNDGEPGARGPSFGITADWLDHRLSIFDFDALVGGAESRESVLLGEVDLSGYEQGPLELKVTPDGKTAVVSVSPGFFTVPGSGLLVGASSIPTGPSRELFVDLESRTVAAELDVGPGPSGIAVTPDGARAFVAHAGSNEVTIIDLKARSILEQVDIGGPFAEQIALDDTGTVGIVTAVMPNSLSKGARTFAVADMKGTLSAPIDLNRDAAGVPFFPGTKTAYVVLAYNPLTSPTSGYAIIDASEPSAPVLVKRTEWDDAVYVNFQAIPFPARRTVLLPVSVGGNVSVREYALGSGDVVLKDTFDLGPTGGMGAFGVAVAGSSHVVLTIPADKMLAVIDLNTRSTFKVPWATQPGPLGIDLY